MKKEPYSKPTVFRVKLNYQQAVLAACSSVAVGQARNGTGLFCRSLSTGLCRRGANRNIDSGASS